MAGELTAAEAEIAANKEAAAKKEQEMKDLVSELNSAKGKAAHLEETLAAAKAEAERQQATIDSFLTQVWHGDPHPSLGDPHTSMGTLIPPLGDPIPSPGDPIPMLTWPLCSSLRATPPTRRSNTGKGRRIRSRPRRPTFKLRSTSAVRCLSGRCRSSW